MKKLKLLLINVILTISLFAQESQLDPDKLFITDGSLFSEYGLNGWSFGYSFGWAEGDYYSLRFGDDTANSAVYALNGMNIITSTSGYNSAFITPDGSCLGCHSSSPTPNNSAILELQSTDKGFLLPRIASTGSISSPITGLMIFENTDNVFRYYDGSNWQTLGLFMDDDFNTFGGRNVNTSTTGESNTIIGYNSFRFNTTGNFNTGYGKLSLEDNEIGSHNTGLGHQALKNNQSGGSNTAIGKGSLRDNISGNNNTAIGRNSFISSTAFNNSTAIGYTSTITASDQVRIGNSNITSIGGFTNWSNISDSRVKKNIRQDVLGLNFIRLLNPVSYQIDVDAVARFHNQPVESDKSKIEKSKIRYTGFIAQEVQTAADEIGYEFSGIDKPKNGNDLYSLRYAEFVVPLVKSIQEQQEMIDNLIEQNQTQREEIEELKRRMNDIEK